MSESGNPRRRKPKPATNDSNILSKPKRAAETGIFATVVKAIITFGIFTLIAFFLCIAYFYINSPINAFPVYDIKRVGELETWLNGKNNELQNGKKLLPELQGAESIAADQEGNLYTGLVDGRIIKITNIDSDNPQIIDMTKGFDYAKDTGRAGKRPHGLRIVNEKLYFADANQGIIEIDINTGKWGKVVGYNDYEPQLMYANDLTVTSDGKTMYFSDVSMRWGHSDIISYFFEMECSSRIFEVDLTTNRITRVVRGGLCFVNGIELDRSETKLLVSENSRRRVAVLDKNSGELVKYVYLIGGADNIRRSKSGGYWAPVPYIVSPKFDFILRFYQIRNLLASVLDLNTGLNVIEWRMAIVVKLDENFEPIHVYYDLDGKVAKFVTHVLELEDGRLFLGSFLTNGITKIDGKLLVN